MTRIVEEGRGGKGGGREEKGTSSARRSETEESGEGESEPWSLPQLPGSASGRNLRCIERGRERRRRRSGAPLSAQGRDLDEARSALHCSAAGPRALTSPGGPGEEPPVADASVQEPLQRRHLVVPHEPPIILGTLQYHEHHHRQRGPNATFRAIREGPSPHRETTVLRVGQRGGCRTGEEREGRGLPLTWSSSSPP